jgi:large subunit ribosomal protein L17
MIKRKKGRKLSREKAQREALLKSLARGLFLKDKIVTTEAKAKELRPYAEKLITIAKKKDLVSRRKLLKYFSVNLVKKIINEIAPRYQNRNGGYTRIIKLGQRSIDGAKVAIIELVK